MKRLCIVFVLFVIVLFGYCLTQTATSQPDPARLASSATAKPRGKNPSTEPTSANADFIATEILGRPTASSVTVNVVAAAPMTIS
jgi:hypothetical protein